MKKITKETIFKVSTLISVIAMGIVISMGGFSYVEANEAATVSGNGSGSDNMINGVTVTDFNVDQDFNFNVTVNNPNKEKICYEIRLYKNGKFMNQSYSYTSDINCYYENNDAETLHTFTNDRFLKSDVYENATYGYEFVYAKSEDEIWGPNSIKLPIVTVKYTKPSKTLPAPNSVEWDSNSAGVVFWDKVDVAQGYDIILLDGSFDLDSFHGLSGKTFWNNFSNRTIFTNEIGNRGTEPYYVKVRSLSKDINNVAHSDWTISKAYFTSDTSKDVNNKLDEIVPKPKEEITQEQVDKIAAMNPSDLQVSMQSNADTLSKIENIENGFNNSKVTINNEVFTDANVGNIKVVGAKLNASKKANVSLNVTNTTDADIENIKSLEQQGYTKENMLAFNMNLTSDGVSSNGNLKVPVRITLPIPQNVDPSRLKILHFSNKGMAPEVYEDSQIKINGDGTFSFTITHFSLFAVVEGKEDAVNPSIPNAESNSEAIVVDSNGNVVAEPARWVPTTPDEIKRYAFLGKEPVVFANAEGNAYPVKVYNSIQGPKCFVSFEAVLADYNMARTYNIYPNNKPGYSMDSKARITIEIPELLRQKGRTFKMICVTEGGTPIVLNDLDKNPNTITFETDKYYAFALIYK